MKDIVYIILVNYNNTKDTVECISSIIESETINYKIIVVDNASSEGTIDKVKSFGDKVILIKNQDNLGFAKANNIGIEYALNQGASFIMLLNNDTIVENGAISKMLHIAEKKQLDILTCKIVYNNKPDKIWYGGGEFTFTRGYGKHYVNNELKEIINEVSFVTGCCILGRENVWKNHLLPTEYFMYFEDVDWSIMQNRNGHKLYYTPLAVIKHKVSATAGIESPFFVYYWNRNRIILLKKYKKVLGASYYIFIQKFIISRFFKILIYTVQNKKEENRKMIMGIKDGLKFQF